MNVHGGPHSHHPGARVTAEFQSLAGAGYVVLLPNPRGSTGYGEAFTEACVLDWGGADFEDIMAGVDVLVKKGVADPDRLYIGGYSYGGFMASWAVGQTDRFRAALVGAPVVQPREHVRDGRHPAVRHARDRGHPQENIVSYAERSPITHLQALQNARAARPP